MLSLLVAGVAEDDHDPVGLPAVAQRRGRVGNRTDRPVLARERLVASPRGLAQLADPQQRAVLRRMRRSVRMLEMDDVVHRFAAQLVLSPPEDPLCSGVHERDTTFVVQRVEALDHRVHHRRAEVFGLRALGYVRHNHPDPDDFVVDHHRVVAGQPVPAILRQRPHTINLQVDYRLARVEHAPIHGLHLRPDIRNQLGDGPADLLLDRRAVDLGKNAVHAYYAQLTVDQGKADRRALLQRLDERQGFGRRALRLHKLGDVLHSANHAQGVPIPLLGKLGERAQPPDAAIGPHNPICHVRQPAVPPRCVELPRNAVPVSRMHPRQHVLRRRRDLARPDTEQAVHVVRPQQLVGLEIPLPGTGAGQPLRPVDHGTARLGPSRIR